MNLEKPFPLKDLNEAWRWFSHSPALMNHHNTTTKEFVEWATKSTTWAIMHEGKPVGMWAFEPIFWPGHLKPTDGYMTIALARGVWGQGFLEQTRHEVLDWIFTNYPSLQRLSAYTAGRNVAAAHAATRLGCKIEGRLRAAIAGDDVIIFGITRSDFYERSNNDKDN